MKAEEVTSRDIDKVEEKLNITGMRRNILTLLRQFPNREFTTRMVDELLYEGAHRKLVGNRIAELCREEKIIRVARGVYRVKR